MSDSTYKLIIGEDQHNIIDYPYKNWLIWYADIGLQIEKGFYEARIITAIRLANIIGAYCINSGTDFFLVRGTKIDIAKFIQDAKGEEFAIVEFDQTTDEPSLEQIADYFDTSVDRYLEAFLDIYIWLHNNFAPIDLMRFLVSYGF